MDRGFLRLLDYWTEDPRRFEEALVRRENLRSGLREVRIDLHFDAILADGSAEAVGCRSRREGPPAIEKF
jgi:hypothetical protein